MTAARREASASVAAPSLSPHTPARGSRTHPDDRYLRTTALVDAGPGHSTPEGAGNDFGDGSHSAIRIFPVSEENPSRVVSAGPARAPDDLCAKGS